MSGEMYRLTARIGHRVGLHKWRPLPDQLTLRCTWCGAIFKPGVTTTHVEVARKIEQMLGRGDE